MERDRSRSRSRVSTPPGSSTTNGATEHVITDGLDEEAVIMLEEVVNIHFGALRSFDLRDAIWQASTEPSSRVQRSRSSKVGRIERLMLSYLQASDQEAQSLGEVLTSACTELHEKLAREAPPWRLRSVRSELLQLYALLKTKVALRISRKEHVTLGYPDDAITDTLTKWSEVNHADVVNQKALLSRWRHVERH